MNKEEIFQQIRGKLIVSCQANEEENPFNPPEEMTRMAKAAAIGGCAGFRANRPENVRMIKEAKLAAVPGSCFGTDGYIRLSYCYADDELRQCLDRLERFLATL